MGISEWYETNNVMPGSVIQLQKGTRPGDVVVGVQSHHSSKDWVRTAMVGTDGGIVYANLKQPISTQFDPHMYISMPSDVSVLDEAWKNKTNLRKPLTNIITEIINDLGSFEPTISCTYRRDLFCSECNPTLPPCTYLWRSWHPTNVLSMLATFIIDMKI